jgi:tetratricopeptide (TPR) repeat protein
MLIFVVAAAMAALLLTASGEDSRLRPAALDKTMERELRFQARAAFLQKVYAPVEALIEAGNPQAALLKLDELGRSFPEDAHGFILRGEILRGMDVLDQAIANYVKGLKLDGDYLEEAGPLSRRTEIRQLVDQGLRKLAPRARSNPDNRSLATAVRELHYLQSRLAGGCE